MSIRLPFRIVLLLLYPLTGYGQTHSLDFYVREGINNNPVRKDLYNQTRSNALDSLKIAAGQKTRLDGNGILQIAPNYRGWGYDPAISNGGVFSALVTASKPVFNQPVLRNQYQSLQLQNRAIDVAVRQNDADLKYNISSQFITVYGDYTQTLLQDNLLLELRKQDGVLLELTRHGLYAEVDYLSFSNTIRAQEISLKQARLQWRNDLYALNLLCGIRDTGLIIPERPVDTPEPAPVRPENSLFLQQFGVDSLKILNSRQTAGLNYRPRINVFADAGMLTSAQLQAYKNFGFSAGINLTVPLYDGHQRLLEEQKLELSEATRMNYKRFTADQIAGETSQIRNQIRETNDLILEIERQIQSAGRLLDLLHVQMNQGTAHMPDLLLATQNWITLKNNLLQANTTRMQLINRLKYRMQ